MGLAFLITSLLVVASPGTGVLLTVAAGLSRGARAGIVTAFGCTLGIVPHLVAAATGLAALLHASALAFQALKLAGVAYLLVMAWTTLKDAGAPAPGEVRPPRSDRETILAAIGANLLNPKLSLFFFAFLPQFLPPDDPHPLRAVVGLGLVFMAMTFAVFVIYGLFAAAMRRHVLDRPWVLAWMRRAFAAAFVGLGVKLALAQRE